MRSATTSVAIIGDSRRCEETVRTLVETKVLTGERGRYRLAQPVHAIQVPPTVQAMLAARIDRLAPEDKRLLQIAAVIGKNVRQTLLQAVAGFPDDALRRGLDHLQGAEFLYETGLFPELEYTFKHALTHEVTYGGLLQERRRALHAQLVDAIETLYRERLGGEIEQLAHHAFRGEKWEKAASYLRQAGTSAVSRSANREARVHYEQALVALQHLPETHETLESAVDLRLDLRNALYAIGELELQLRCAREAERLARKLGDRGRIALTSAWMAASLAMAGRPASEAMPFAETAMTIGGLDDDVRLHAQVNLHAGQHWFYAGDLRRSEGALQNVVRVLEDDPGQGRMTGTGVFPAVYSRCLLAWSLATRGEFDRAAAYGREAIDLAESLDTSQGVVTACWALGYLHAVKGETNPAVRWWERGLRVARDTHRAVPDVLIAGSLCYLYALSGRAAESLVQLDDAIKGHESLRAGGVVHSLIAVHLAEACMLTGRRQEALTLAGRALTLTRERGQRAFEGWALRLLAELASSDAPAGIEISEERWREAMAIATELEMRPLVAHCHLGLAKLYRASRRREGSEAHFTTGTTMCREMGMMYWLEKAEAELGAR